MKKLFAILLAVALLASVAIVASAATTTTLTTTVPSASYTLNIPADQEIAFGATTTNIGNVTVSNSAGFADGKNLQVTMTYGAFECPGVSTKIPLHLVAKTTNSNWSVNLNSNDTLTFYGDYTGSVDENASFYQQGHDGWYDMTALNVCVDSLDWGKALAGDYTATITFTAEVVAE